MLPASDPGGLRAFLEHPSRAAGTLSYDELQGFLFTVVSAPEMIPMSEWMPIIFAGEDVDYANVEEAKAVIGQIMALYGRGVRMNVQTAGSAAQTTERHRTCQIVQMEPQGEADDRGNPLRARCGCTRTDSCTTRSDEERLCAGRKNRPRREGGMCMTTTRIT